MRLPDVPVTVTVAVPLVAVELALSVNVLVVPAGFGLKLAVTPLGRPEADKATVPLKPFAGVIVIVLEPLVPSTTVKVLGLADNAKLGAAFTVRLIVVVSVKLPDVPVTLTVAVPVVADADAVNVKVLIEVAGFGLNAAVTPDGSPEAEKLTLPLKPFAGVIVSVLVAVLPCTTVALLGLADNVKVGAGVIVRAIVVL